MYVKTIKLEIDIDYSQYKDLQRVYSSVVRYSYNRFQEKCTEQEIRALVKSLFKISSWFAQCAIRDAKATYLAKPNIVFGGKINLKKRSLNKITNEEWKSLRLRPISIEGEKLQKSNRHFNFYLTNQVLIFKLDKSTHIPIKLFNIGRNRQKDLDWLQTQVGQIPISIKLTKTHIYITFEDTRKEEIYKLKHRVMGLDLNPNYIGVSVLDINSTGKEKVIASWSYDLTDILGNKQNFELIKIASDIQNKAKHYHISRIGIEALNIQAKDHKKGKRFNKLVNNDWNRNLFLDQLSKRMTRIGVGWYEVNPAYSSTIGNLRYPTLFDPQASACEIARRAYFMYVKKKCMYPDFKPEYLAKQWKQELDFDKIDSWVSLHKAIKNLKLKYRVPLLACKSSGLRLASYKSYVNIHQAILY